MIILLDYNSTLTLNYGESKTWLAENRGRSFADWIPNERYREWLVPLIRPHHVILITARPHKFKEETLATIRRKLSWEPAEAYFNEHRQSPPECKRGILHREVYPRHGRPSVDVAYLALESNPFTREMYGHEGIVARRIYRPLRRLPYGDGNPPPPPVQPRLFP